jgi:hypothetical protein
MEEKHMTEQKPPPAGEPGQTPPLQPGEGGGGYMGLGEPYVDFIPTFPLVKDPATGEWRTVLPDSRLDPNAPADPGLPPQSESGDVDQSFKVTEGVNQTPPGLEDDVAALEKTLGPDEVITINMPVDQNPPLEDTPHPGLDNRLDPNAPYEPGLPKLARDDLGQPPPGDSSEPPPPAPDPETVQALDPNLLNPLEQDPTYLYQIEQHPGLAEQWSNDDPSFTDPSEYVALNPRPLPPEPSPDLFDTNSTEASYVMGLSSVRDSYLTDPSLTEDPATADQDVQDQDFGEGF